MRIVTHTLPTFWAAPLFYDDYSGLTPEDQAHFDAFCKHMSSEHHSWHCVEMSDDTDFMRYHDAHRFGVLACNVTTFMFHVADAQGDYHAQD